MRGHHLATEEGTYATLFAFVILTMFGFSALAVDLSDSFEDAREQQTYADLACLAGVRHLPQDPDTASQKARENLGQNIAGEWSGDELGGYEIAVITPHDDDATKMRVEVANSTPTTFGRFLGVDDVRVVQAATCGVFTMGGSLPFGTMPGHFGGTLQNSPPCGGDEGNCWQLEIPRSDVGGGVGNPQAKWFHLNVAWDTDRSLIPWSSDNSISCTTDTPECNVVEAKQGITKGQLSDAVSLKRNIPEVGGDVPGRLHVGDGWGWDTYETPTKRYVEDKTPMDLLFDTEPADPPDSWDEDLYGPWDDFTFVTQINTDNCEHPRFGNVPILRHHPSGDASWPAGNSGHMRVIGHRWAYLYHPGGPDHHDSGSDHIETVKAEQLWFGDETYCGSANGPVMDYQPGSPKVWKLVPNS